MMTESLFEQQKWPKTRRQHANSAAGPPNGKSGFKIARLYDDSIRITLRLRSRHLEIIGWAANEGMPEWHNDNKSVGRCEGNCVRRKRLASTRPADFNAESDDIRKLQKICDFCMQRTWTASGKTHLCSEPMGRYSP